MHTAARSCLTAGVALVGAGVIAVTPVIAPPADVHVRSAAVELSAAATEVLDPLSMWAEVLTTAGDNLGLIGERVLADPAPLLRQFVANVGGYGEIYATALQSSATGAVTWLASLPATLQEGIDAMNAGDYRRGATLLWSPVTGWAIPVGFPWLAVLQIPIAVTQNMANVVATLPAVATTLGFKALNILASPAAMGRFILEPIADALAEGDTAQAVGIALNGPAILTDFILNRNVLAPGPVNAGLLTQLLVDVPKRIANAITPVETPEPTGEVSGLFGPPAVATVSEVAATEPSAPTVSDKTRARTGLVKELTTGVTDAANTITNTATSAVTAARTVTLSLDPKLKTTKMSTATGVSAADESTKVSKKEARAAKRQARQEASAARQQVKRDAKGDGKHRAAKDTDE